MIDEAKKEIMVINSSAITTDDYQRSLRPGHVKYIVDNWQEAQAEMPRVSWRDNKYYVFDGQHTTKARIIRNGGEDLDIECVVYTGLTREDEADLFVKLNSNKKSVTFNERLKSNYIAGDKDAIDIVDTITGKGLDVSFSSTSARPNTVSALNKATQIYARAGKDGLDWVLDIAKDCWADDKYGMSSAILGGLFVIYNAYREDKRFSKEDFIKAMTEESPSVIIREGRELSMGGDKRYAKRMVERYNKRSTRKLRVAKIEI